MINADPCATVRCASGTHCVASGSTAACVATGGGYGAACGGFIANAATCASGYTCVLSSNSPDVGGFWPGLIAFAVMTGAGGVLGWLVGGLLFRPSSGGPLDHPPQA